jgi:hypothetical protein
MRSAAPIAVMLDGSKPRIVIDIERAAQLCVRLTLGYDRHPAVHHISGEVARGDLLALVGPKAPANRPLLKGIVGQLKPQVEP